MSFDSLGLSDSLLRAIEKKGYTKPSPIQEKAIPVILDRKDVLASAQTGTGKTAGFTLPILQILSEGPDMKRRNVRALILTPTRELAAQILENVEAYSEFVNLRSTVIFGGVKQNPQVARLRRGIDVLVATPGRLLDLHSQNLLSLAKVEILVLDEADRMLDMGFQRDIQKILKILPKRRQNLLFSATFSAEIKKLANELLYNPVSVEATPQNTTAEKINQKVIKTDKKKKTNLIIKLISEGNWKQVLVFTRTKHGANRLNEKLNKSSITAAAIHGNKTQNARTKALEGFKSGTIRVLVATDIAARGIDIPLLPYVVNFELPNVSEDYVHRIGRTGRAGAKGIAISLVSPDETDYLRGIERLLKQKLPSEMMEGFEPDPNAPTSPPPKKSFNRNSNQKKKSGQGRPNQGSKNQTGSSAKSKNNKRGFYGRKSR